MDPSRPYKGIELVCVNTAVDKDGKPLHPNATKRETQEAFWKELPSIEGITAWRCDFSEDCEEISLNIILRRPEAEEEVFQLIEKHGIGVDPVSFGGEMDMSVQALRDLDKTTAGCLLDMIDTPWDGL